MMPVKVDQVVVCILCILFLLTACDKDRVFSVWGQQSMLLVLNVLSHSELKEIPFSSVVRVNLTSLACLLLDEGTQIPVKTVCVRMW